ncbi:MAG: hypothetical protein ACI4C1_08630 [Lachnospiraceae bacterium]
MKYPCLVPKRLCKTEIHIILEQEDVDEDGAPIMALESDFLCNYQDSAKRLYQDNKQYVQLSGIALLPGDIAPKMSALPSGWATVYGEKRRIYQAQKCRNPDGSVNYTRLELV